MISLESLLDTANKMRWYACKMCLEGDSGHPTSSLSCTDILATLFFSEMGPDDLFILSKGHAVPALYAVYFLKGMLSKEQLFQLRKIDSALQGHPDIRFLKSVNASTGALGQGLSMAIGRAHGIQLKNENRYVYCVIGDGESQEGQIWEAALYGGNRNLKNLIAFTDYNKGQSDGPLSQIMPMGDLKKKWESFNWFVLEINGHDIGSISEAVKTAKHKNDNRPTMVIANTQKGYVKEGATILKGDHSGKVTKADLTFLADALNLNEAALC